MIEGPNANFSNALPKRNNESPSIGGAAIDPKEPLW